MVEVKTPELHYSFYTLNPRPVRQKHCDCAPSGQLSANEAFMTPMVSGTPRCWTA